MSAYSLLGSVLGRDSHELSKTLLLILYLLSPNVSDTDKHFLL